jgi:flagellar biosynthesis chaperone FliJ
MTMNKEQLETRIKELGVLIEEASGNVQKLVDEQTKLTTDLEDFNKPKLTKEQWEQVDSVITRCCEAFELDLDNCEYEMEMDYDNRVQLHNFDIGYQMTDLADHITDRMNEVFGLAEEE